ncbi:hypothetical protein [Mycobacterium intracellulare]|uniref:hypothetical protein n=1 Tax=Mycobacterium intracellulare TaxID=1767 RepID=UPI00115544C9|nr:hypothetical protein [Mycobacterium intracellulare]
MTEMLTQMQTSSRETPLEDEAVSGLRGEVSGGTTRFVLRCSENLDRLGRSSFSLNWMKTGQGKLGCSRAPEFAGIDLYRHQPPAGLRDAARAQCDAQFRPGAAP